MTTEEIIKIGKYDALLASHKRLVEALALVHDKVLTEYHDRESYVRQKAEAALLQAREIET